MSKTNNINEKDIHEKLKYFNTPINVDNFENLFKNIKNYIDMSTNINFLFILGMSCKENPLSNK